MPRVVNYLAALSPARAVLWCYLLWWAVVVVNHFDASPRLWATSIGLSVIIGVALVLNAESGGARRMGGWQRFRFFLAPFCVSSFAALVKGQGFVLVVSPRWQEIAEGVLACVAFVGLVSACRAGARVGARAAAR